MAKKKISKKTQKKIIKGMKKHPLLSFIALALVAIIAVCYLHWNKTITVSFLNGIIPQKQEEPVVLTDEELQFHFIELGNKYSGDCTLVKVGNTEVLIDAGSRKNSAKSIVPYLKNYCTDGVLEYVIATHAHEDHIAGFVGLADYDGVFESFVCETIIDYPLSESTSKIRADYEALRDAEVSSGAKHYTALECWNNENGAKRSYTLADGITMNILYQKYYEQDATTENNYSVCLLFSQGANDYLFTGDLEESGEQSLVATRENKLTACRLYKAGHHGSKTSSTSELLAVVQPEIVCVSCCCGSDEYTDANENQFPTQAFIDRVSVYTTLVYVTSIVSNNENGFESMNGNIVVEATKWNITVKCSNNDILLKDTDWFKANRTTPQNWRN